MSESRGVTSHDKPRATEPQRHFSSNTFHQAWIDTSGLLRKRLGGYQPFVRQSNEARGNTPE